MDNRLRWLSGFNLRIPKQLNHAQNIAKNMSLQSANASIVKKALAMLDERIHNKGWDEEALIVLTIHDEIVVECKEEIAEEVKVLLSNTMIEAAEYWVKKIPIIADAYIADHWKK